ncbi:GDSL lipase/esterase [Phialemonium atrogriseum]|uniref:GDSL lipase/esterase n=1 Tax=Phialemonium atrogriseum TaxID=1093897 RepID=A0AAJ0C803_9PEZI|nr:GDSL lipase/esterase [Phialemonium atrogriseum]KAK1771661.1 GDSL lipase/esterase [Phialemonium atrogriseum]
MLFFSLLVAGASIAAAASGCGAKKPFENLVVFGDSYSDNGRMSYIVNHDGKNPPPGVYQDVSNVTASGGLTWGHFIVQHTGVNLVDYAISGATCSNEIISRQFDAIKRPFPSVMDDEIPTFKEDVAFESLYPNRTAENTVYALWIGTNDLGFGAFLTDSQAPGTTITDFVNCIWDVFDAVYQTGGRRFVLLNEAPLELSPLYAAPEAGGALNNQYWTNKTLYNMTEYSYKIKEYTTNVNTMFDYGAPFQLLVKSRWPGATFSIFNVHQLLKDISENPSDYLDSPANSTGFYHHCKATDNSDCVDLPEVSSSAFLWFDELHPSEKSNSIIAEHFLDVVDGQSKYGTYYGSQGKK